MSAIIATLNSFLDLGQSLGLSLSLSSKSTILYATVSAKNVRLERTKQVLPHNRFAPIPTSGVAVSAHFDVHGPPSYRLSHHDAVHLKVADEPENFICTS